MKTFLGDMRDYIYESSFIGQKVVEHRKEITANFVKALKEESPKRIIITGAGTSNYSAQAVRHYFEKMLGIRTCVLLPTPLADGLYLVEDSTLCIGISATGSSASTIKAMDHVRKQGGYTIALTNALDSPIVHHVDQVLFLDHGIEDVSPKSKSFSCELVTLVLCALEASLSLGKIGELEYQNHINRLSQTINNLSSIAEKSELWFEENADDFMSCNRMLVLGYNQNFGIIQEAALKILECARFQCTPYELEEFMHGIYHSIDAETYFLYLGGPGKQYSRLQNLYQYFEPITNHQYLISSHRFKKNSRDLIINFLDDEDFYMIEYIVPCQILAYNMAVQRSINPNAPKDRMFHLKMNSKYIEGEK